MPAARKNFVYDKGTHLYVKLNITNDDGTPRNTAADTYTLVVMEPGKYAPVLSVEGTTAGNQVTFKADPETMAALDLGKYAYRIDSDWVEDDGVIVKRNAFGSFDIKDPSDV